MQEPMIPLRLPPGLYKNGTVYQSKGRWYDANLVRFIDGTIRPVGGWRRLQDSTGAELAALTGKPRAGYAFRGNNGSVRIAFGTHSKLYIVIAGVLTDITPASLTAGNQDGSYAGGSGTYGSGAYGSGPYGGITLANTLTEADTWTLDNFGEHLVACLTSDGRILSWDGDTANNAEPVANGPTGVRAVVVTPERFLVALGTANDPRLVKWASQESETVWTAAANNTAGDFPLSTSGRFVAGRRTRKQTLIWTDVDLWTMTFIGGTLVYAFDQVGEACGLIGPQAAAVIGSRAIWMGTKGFFQFDGYVTPVDCEVADYVFNDMNVTQRAKIQAGTRAEYHEVWWFYPSAGSTENDRYVVYNYKEGHWTVGKLARGAMVDRGVPPSPIMVDTSGQMWEHEVGFSRTGASGPYIESGPLELDEGDRLVRVQKIIPDSNAKGSLDLVVKGVDLPNGTERTHGTFLFTAGQATDTRFTERSIRLQFREETLGDWRLGIVRLAGRPQGRR
jgi:hypothetical protein